MVKLALKRYHGIFANRTYSGEEMKEDYVAMRPTKKDLMPPLDCQELREEGRKPETGDMEGHSMDRMSDRSRGEI